MAGIIAAFGVIYADVTLVVGAMTIRMDTMQRTATATALILRRWRLAGRAVVAPIGGLGLACLVGGLMTRALSLLDLLRNWFAVGQSAVVQHLNPDRRSCRGGGGDSRELRCRRRDLGHSDPRVCVSRRRGVVRRGVEGARALLVGVNVAMLLVGGFATLIVQRMLPRRMPGSTTVR